MDWPNSLRGTCFSTRIEREPPNFPTSSLALMRKFMSMIKTIMLANQSLEQPCVGMEQWVLTACDINNLKPTSWFPSLPYGYMSIKSCKWSSCVHMHARALLFRVNVWHLHFHSGCVAELGAGSWVFLSPVLPSSSGHWTCATPSFPPQ